jgi:serine/threonine protein kinase
MTEDQDVVGIQEEFGPYLVYERLGVGGMATVHRALERGIEGFERVVALKRLLPHLAEDASFIKSFVREAKLASMLAHPNIVQILELGRVGPTYFISMEHIDGRDIRKLLRHARRVSGPPPINVTIGLMLQLCDALDYAHNRTDTEGHPLGLVHRDLSPSNLLLTRSGHLKVIDFGIAKAQSAQLRTQTGRVKGKLAYMAPESIAGKELDSRSDLFSAGVVFHELLTARPLFAQKNEYQTLLKVQRGEVGPPSAFNEGVPKELDDIVLKALARDPEDRWPSAAALRDALVTVRMARQLSATPRDVATWCDWAFALEPPSAGFSGKTFTEGLASFGGTASPVARTPVPQPARARTPQAAAAGDEEAAAELAWGAPEQESGVIHIHDEVPDVSGKVPLAAAGDLGLGGDTDSDGQAFDPALMDAGATNPEMPLASTIRTHAVPPPGSRSALRPAAFPAGSSDDALERARRPRASSKQPVARPTGAQPTTQRGPGVGPARGSAMNLLDAQPATAVPDAPRVRAPSIGPAIGASIAARPTHGVRNAVIALVVLGLAATGITLAITTGDDKVESADKAPPALPAPRATGTVKFTVKPADAIIKVAGLDPHPGSPWQTELAAGQYQLEIQREGYKTYLAPIELSAGETQTQVIQLEQIGEATGTAATSTLIVDPSTPGLEVVLDGTVLDRRTPVRMDIEPGPHTVALRQDGVEVWSEEFTATANATHKFDPSMTDDKKRERKSRRERERDRDDDDDDRDRDRDDSVRTADRDDREPAVVTLAPPPPTTPPAISVTPPKPDLAKAGPTTPVAPAPPTHPTVTTPAPTPVPGPVAAPARSSGPETIPPNKVSRVSGSVPVLKTRDGRDAKIGMISARVCIDGGGRVTSASVMSKLSDSGMKETLEISIRSWRYTPYTKDGKAVPACFVASFRAK